MKKIKFWVARALRHERTPGYLIYEWLDGLPPPLCTRALCEKFVIQKGLNLKKMKFKISIHEDDRVTYMMVTEDELDVIVERYPDAEIFILNIPRLILSRPSAAERGLFLCAERFRTGRFRRSRTQHDAT